MKTCKVILIGYMCMYYSLVYNDIHGANMN